MGPVGRLAPFLLQGQQLFRDWDERRGIEPKNRGYRFDSIAEAALEDPFAVRASPIEVFRNIRASPIFDSRIGSGLEKEDHRLGLRGGVDQRGSALIVLKVNLRSKFLDSAHRRNVAARGRQHQDRTAIRGSRIHVSAFIEEPQRLFKVIQPNRVRESLGGFR